LPVAPETPSHLTVTGTPVPSMGDCSA
jgi:hypothetical protein